MTGGKKAQQDEHILPKSTKRVNFEPEMGGLG